jgi:hypothetical protein
MKAFFTPLVFCAAVFALARSASADTVSLYPTADAFVSAANPNSNYGSAGALAVSAGALPKGEFDSLLQFNFSSATANFNTTFGAGLWQIDSITLQLTSSTPNNAIFNGNGAGPGGSNVNSAGLFSINLMTNNSWTEGTGTPAAPTTTGITYSTLSSFLSASDESLGTFSFGGGTTGNNTYSLGLTSSLLADASGGNTVSLLALPADNGVAYVVNSSNFPTMASRPLLMIDASVVPEPDTYALLVMGAAAVWFARRRYHERTP